MPEVTIDKDSSEEAIETWISNCIRTVRREGKTAEQAAGQCYGQARQATGKRLGKRR